METYDPAVNLTRYPRSMSEFGGNPYGEDLYRIVYSTSVRHLVGGKWADNGSAEYRWTPTYDFEGWVLERWHSSMQFTGMSRAQWDLTYKDPVSGFLTLGPYPDRGAYAEVHRFSCSIEDANLQKLVYWVEQSQKNSWQDIRDANRDAYEQREKADRAQLEDAIAETRRAHGHRPMAGQYSRYNTKTAPDSVTAETLHRKRGLPLPTPGQGHQFVTGRFRNA